MVVFICDACGDSVKKPGVEKHKFKCRNCYNLSCIDCNKDFPGDAYKEHSKCISEEEKYSGKGFVPRASANKGEKKQDEWIEKVQNAIEHSKANAKLKNVLLQIKHFDNIPRKKLKFGKFLENSLRIRDTKLIEEAWNAINVTLEETNEETIESVETTLGVDNVSEDAKKLNKKERKALRAEHKGKKEKKDKKCLVDVTNESSLKRKYEEDGVESQEDKETVKNSKKSKKKKADELCTSLDGLNVDDSYVKIKKKNDQPVESSDVLFENTNHEISELSYDDQPKTKFEWEDMIFNCVQKKKGQLSLKKVQKKVFTEYWCTTQFSDYAEQKAISKFQKAILKSTRLKLQSGDVCLI